MGLGGSEGPGGHHHSACVCVCAHTRYTGGNKEECACVEAAEVCNITGGCIRRISFSTSLCTLFCVPARSCRVKLNGFPTKCKNITWKDVTAKNQKTKKIYI